MSHGRTCHEEYETQWRNHMSDNSNSLVPKPKQAPSVVTLGPLNTIDLSFLPDAQREALMTDYARGALDVAKKAHELGVDVNVMKVTLDNLANTVREVSESGNAVTVTHTQTTKIGRTEIKMGNTDEAKTGKMTRSQTGEHDWTPYYVFAGVIAFILIVFLFVNGHH
jgi:hypothetical protein